MNILIIGGMHGNEPLGIELVKMFQNKPQKNITVVFANEEAMDSNVRFTSADLNRSFPGQEEGTYEEKRAAFLLKMCSKYDIAFDFHNTHCPDNDCSFIGDTASKDLLSVSAYLGLKKIIIADYDCINKYAPNCISIEISLSSKKMDTNYWYKRLTALSQLSEMPTKKKVETYRFVYRMTLEDRDRLNLLKKNLKAFQPIEESLATNMGVANPAYPIFINDTYTPYNFGGLLNKLS